MQERASALEQAIEATGLTQPSGAAAIAPGVYVRTRQALVSGLWGELLVPVVVTLLEYVTQHVNLLKLPLSGSERQYFTHRWLDAEREVAAGSGGVRAQDEVGMLRQICLALHSRQSLRDLATGWAETRAAVHPGESRQALLDWLALGVLGREQLDRLTTDDASTGVVLGFDGEMARAMISGLDADLYARQEVESDRVRTVALDLLRNLYLRQFLRYERTDYVSCGAR